MADQGRVECFVPRLFDGHLYFAQEQGVVYCLNADDGQAMYEQRLEKSVLIYPSPIVSDGKLYYVSQHNGVFVLAARPEFEQLAKNLFADDDSRANASPVPDDGQLLIRTDRRLYCIGEK